MSLLTTTYKFVVDAGTGHLTLEKIGNQVNAMNTTLTRLGPALSSVDRGVSQVSRGISQMGSTIMRVGVGSLAALTAASYASYSALRLVSNQFFAIGEQFKSVEITLSSSLKSMTLAKKLTKDIEKMTAFSPLPMTELANVVRSIGVIPDMKSAILREATNGQGGGNVMNTTVGRMTRLVEKMASFRPDQGAEGAIFAIREAMGGELRSLIRRFDLSPQLLSRASGEKLDVLKKDPTKMASALEKMFDDIISDSAVKRFARLPTKLMENIIEQSFVIPLKRIGDAGLFDKIMYDSERVLNKVIAIVNSLMDVEKVGNVASKMSDDIGRLYDNIISVTSKHLAKNFPGMNAEETVGKLLTSFTRFLADELPPALDKLITVIPKIVTEVKNFASVIRDFLSVLAKGASMISGMFGSSSEEFGTKRGEGKGTSAGTIAGYAASAYLAKSLGLFSLASGVASTGAGLYGIGKGILTSGTRVRSDQASDLAKNDSLPSTTPIGPMTRKQYMWQKAGVIGNKSMNALAIAGIGASAYGGLDYMGGDSPSKMNTAGKFGVAIGTGAVTGAAIGSIIPGWGTAAGAVVGGLIGFYSALKQTTDKILDVHDRLEARARISMASRDEKFKAENMDKIQDNIDSLANRNRVVDFERSMGFSNRKNINAPKESAFKNFDAPTAEWATVIAGLNNQDKISESSKARYDQAWKDARESFANTGSVEDFTQHLGMKNFEAYRASAKDSIQSADYYKGTLDFGKTGRGEVFTIADKADDFLARVKESVDASAMARVALEAVDNDLLTRGFAEKQKLFEALNFKEGIERLKELVAEANKTLGDTDEYKGLAEQFTNFNKSHGNSGLSKGLTAKNMAAKINSAKGNSTGAQYDKELKVIEDAFTRSSEQIADNLFKNQKVLDWSLKKLAETKAVTDQQVHEAGAVKVYQAQTDVADRLSSSILSSSELADILESYKLITDTVGKAYETKFGANSKEVENFRRAIAQFDTSQFTQTGREDAYELAELMENADKYMINQLNLTIETLAAFEGSSEQGKAFKHLRNKANTALLAHQRATKKAKYSSEDRATNLADGQEDLAVNRSIYGVERRSRINRVDPTSRESAQAELLSLTLEEERLRGREQTKITSALNTQNKRLNDKSLSGEDEKDANDKILKLGQQQLELDMSLGKVGDSMARLKYRLNDLFSKGSDARESYHKEWQRSVNGDQQGGRESGKATMKAWGAGAQASFKDNLIKDFSTVARAGESMADALDDSMGKSLKAMIKEGASLKDMFVSLGDTAVEVLIDIAVAAIKAAVKMALVKTISSIIGGFGYSDTASSMLKLSSGGLIQNGSGTKDDVPALLTRGEYVLNRRAVEKLGMPLVTALNDQGRTGSAMPADLLSSISRVTTANSAGSDVRNVPKFLSGGLVGGDASVVNSPNGSVGGSGNKVEIINITDPAELDARLASNPQLIVNAIRRNRQVLRQILR